MKYILGLILILIVFSCGRPTFVPDTNSLSFKELLYGVTQNHQRVKTISGSCSITVESPEFSGSFSANVLVCKPDSMLLKAFGPFGIRLGTLFIGEQRFVFYNQMSNKFYNGAVNDFKGRTFFQFPLNLSQLVDIFSANDPIPNMKVEQYRIEDGEFFIAGTDNKNDYQIWIDPQSGRIRKFESLKDQKVVLRKEYKEFQKTGDAWFPKRLQIVIPEKQQGMALFFSKIQINKAIDPGEFEVTISDQADQIKTFIP